MPQYRKPEFREMPRSSSAGQAYRFAGVAVAVIVAAMLLGAVIQSRRDESNLSRKQEHMSTMTHDLESANGEKEHVLADLTIEMSELIQRFEALKTLLSASQADRDALAGEVQFLTRYIAYVTGPKGTKNPALVDVVCSLWKGADKRKAKFESQPLQITAEDFDQAHFSPELQTLLAENFVRLEPVLQIRLGEAAQAGSASPSAPAKPAARQAAAGGSITPQMLASLGKQVQGIKILKAIGFSDGARYEIPRDIAIAVQIRRECMPH
ncbi:MAG: hypothetical protein ACHQAY_17610 [Hyphomicrobiales bacterium]